MKRSMMMCWLLLFMLSSALAGMAPELNFVDIESISVEDGKLDKDEFHAKYPRLTVQGVNLTWNAADGWYHYEAVPGQRAMFMSFPTKDGRLSAKLATPDRRKDGKVVEVFNNLQLRWLDNRPRAEPVRLDGRIEADNDSGKFTLHVHDVGVYELDAPERSEKEIDQTDLWMLRGTLLRLTGKYDGDGVIRPTRLEVFSDIIRRQMPNVIQRVDPK